MPPTDLAHSRILIVDDQTSNIQLLEFVLRRAGFLAVSSTTDPRRVAELHHQNHFQLILLDIQMPYLNGFAVMEELRAGKEGSEVAVLILTADPSQMTRALTEGADGFLSKPFVLTEVLEQVRLILGRRLDGVTPLPAVTALTSGPVRVPLVG